MHLLIEWKFYEAQVARPMLLEYWIGPS